MPFWPGGLDDPSSSVPEELGDELAVTGKGIRNIPPGFTRGLQLPGEEDETELDGLDGIQKHLAVGQGDVVSTPPIQTAPAWLTSSSQPSSSRWESNGPPLVGTSEIDELLPTSVSVDVVLQLIYQQILLFSAHNSHPSVQPTVLQDAPKFRNASGLEWWI